MTELFLKLVAIEGPLQGQVFPFSEEELSIGRDAANHLPIADGSLSRRHCRLVRAGDEITLTDLGSLNGTFVNGVPVRERQLAHGDRLRLGDSTFLFLAEDGEPPDSRGEVMMTEEEDGECVATLTLQRDEALYLDSVRLQASLTQDSRTARDLNVLLELSGVLNRATSVEELERRMMELLIEAIPAWQGALLFASDAGGEFTECFGWDREGGRTSAITVSRRIAQRVLAEGVAILSRVTPDAATDSLLASGVRSLLAVPLTARTRRLGVLWLATSDPVAWFDEGHLQLATAAAAMAAVAIENLQWMEGLASENRRLRKELHLDHDMIGEGPRMKEVYQRIARVAPSDSTILIRGESGTGKELAALAIHRNSPRADKPFIAINCAALTETLLESELFGHEKGAFTGAVAQKKGKLELAEGGTLFLDEIGEMAPLLQAKLLRVLQQREYERVGGTRTLKADIRLIAATNRDLEAAIREGSFRQDLYYRLNVITLRTPPLRERREDIPLLAAYFATKYGERCKRPIRGIAPEARELLAAYDWPGNVRELENAIERAVVLGAGDWIQAEDLPETLLDAARRETVDIRRARQRIAVAAERGLQVVNADEQDVGLHRGNSGAGREPTRRKPSEKS